METRLITCPNCGATIAVPRNLSAVKCPYCGYQISLVNQTVNGLPVFMLPVKVKKSKALSILLTELSKQVGVSEECMESAERARDEMFVVPYVVYDADAVGIIEYDGYRGDVSFQGEIAVPLVEGWPVDIHVPPAARVPYDPNVLRGAKVLDLGDFKKAETVARALAQKKLQDLAMARGQVASVVKLDVSPVAIVYVPFHRLTYADDYALINASNGELLKGTYTQRVGTRLLALGGGIAAILAGLAASFLSHSILPSLIGLAGAIPLLLAAGSKKRTFGTLAEERLLA